jgi:periplasmic divalent cation tolerance protein
VPRVVSIYRWKGAVERAEEWLLLLKTTSQMLEPLRQALLELHPYELPELVALPIVGGHVPYLGWLDDSVRHRS